MGKQFCGGGVDGLRGRGKRLKRFKKFLFKMDMCRFAYTTCENILVEFAVKRHGQFIIVVRYRNTICYKKVRERITPLRIDRFLIKMKTLNDTITVFSKT